MSLKFFKGAFLGAIIGSVVGMLYAPAKGEQTRKKLTKKSKKYITKGRSALKKAQRKGARIEEDLKPVMERGKRELKTFAKKTSPKIKNLADDLEDAVKKMKRK